MAIKTLRIRIKDKHASWLQQQANLVNFVWNYCQEISLKALHRENRFLSGYDLAPFVNGATKEGLDLPSPVVQEIAVEYARKRKQFKKAKLRWRASKGSRRALGWVPLRNNVLSYRNGQVWYHGKPLSLWDSYGLAQYADEKGRLGAGHLAEDSGGRWFLCVTVNVPQFCGPKKPQGLKSSVGIDLGLKDFLTTSSGQKESAQQFYRDLEPALATAQRANKKNRVKAIHQKIANRRKDHLHKLSTALVRKHNAIFVGNVNASQLAKTKLAKSVLDASWSAFRDMLKYKSEHAAIWFEEVDEKFTSVTCSCCKKRTGPKGLEGLRIREWQCVECGAVHDRDINAAQNILALGRERLAEGSLTPVTKDRAVGSVAG